MMAASLKYIHTIFIYFLLTICFNTIQKKNDIKSGVITFYIVPN